MPEHSYRIYKKAKEMGLPSQIFYHQNGHGGPPPMKMMNRWFTRYLHGIENNVENDSKAQIVRENDKMDEPTAYKAYPNPEAEAVTFYLNGGAPEVGSLSTNKSASKGKETLVDNYSFSAEALAQADYTNHRLLYVTPILKEDVHISGLSSITIKAASSKAAVNLSVYLVSLPWNKGRRSKITDNIITRGWADLQNHKSLSKSAPLKKGKFYEMTFDLQPDDQIIKKGQQIGLMIFSSDNNYTLLPKPGTELTVDLEGTMITIPVVGGKQAFQKAVD
jgi:X-Pro dipeptidyl-peptidase